MRDIINSLTRELLDRDLPSSTCSAIDRTIRRFQLVQADLGQLADHIRKASEAIEQAATTSVAFALGPQLATEHLEHCQVILLDLLSQGEAEDLQQSVRKQQTDAKWGTLHQAPNPN